MRLHRSIAVVLLFQLPPALLADAKLSYAGFTVDTTIEEVAGRYPHSNVGDTWVAVADADSHDFIRHISVIPSGITLGLVRKLASGEEVFPHCLEVFDRIYAAHGGPDIVQNLQEEAIKVHRRVWKRGNEYLSLRCLERDGERLAEVVQLYRFGDSAI